MDPEACLDRADEALAEGDRAEVRTALSNYSTWRLNGGYQPKGGDARARLLAAAVRSRKSLQRNSNSHFWILVNGEPYIANDDEPGTIVDYFQDHPKSKIPSVFYDMKPGESRDWNAEIITRVGGDACRLINITYEVITPESAAEGDVAERGWLSPLLITADDLDEDDPSWVDATIRALQNEGIGSVEADSSHGTPRWFTEIDGDMDDQTGAETRRSIHPEGFTKSEMDALGKALR
jgi:hypothetical protein